MSDIIYKYSEIGIELKRELKWCIMFGYGYYGILSVWFMIIDGFNGC